MPQTIIVLVLFTRDSQKVLVRIDHVPLVPMRHHEVLHSGNLRNVNHQAPCAVKSVFVSCDDNAVQRRVDGEAATVSSRGVLRVVLCLSN